MSIAQIFLIIFAQFFCLRGDNNYEIVHSGKMEKAVGYWDSQYTLLKYDK